MRCNQVSLLVRWWTTFSVLYTAIGTALYLGLAKNIYQTDLTFISFVTLVLGLIGSLFVGRAARTRTSDPVSVTRRARYIRHAKWISELCTSLGLLGTIIGLVITLGSAFQNVDVSSSESLKRVIVVMGTGMGTALYTTLCGLVSFLVIQVQIRLSGVEEDR